MLWLTDDLLLKACIFFLSLIRQTRCDKFVNAIEGEVVRLDFPYPCNSSMVTLQYANRLPFYTSGDPETLKLNPDQSRRFKVENRTEESQCFLLLSIDPLQRLDGGTYILLAYSIDDYVTRIGLHVDFLPGMAHCSFGGNHDYEQDWGRLHCRASVGSMLGKIQCFQGGMRMPPLGAPSENDETLKQTILVQNIHQHVYCCSFQLIEPKDRCDCEDFVWDPLSKGKVNNPRDPCPNSTPTHFNTLYTPKSLSYQEKSAKAESLHTDISNANTTTVAVPLKHQKTYLKSESRYAPYSGYIIMVILFVAIFLVYIVRSIWLTRAKFLPTRVFHRSIKRGTMAYLMSWDQSYCEEEISIA